MSSHSIPAACPISFSICPTKGRRLDSLTAIGTGYVDYAIAEPGLFRLLFTAYPEVPGGDQEPGDPFAMLNAALDDLVTVGYLAAGTRPGAEISCWSAVHGFSVLCTERPLRGLGSDDRDAALAAMLATIDTAYGVS